MANTIAAIYALMPNAISRWPLNEASGTTATDTIGSANGTHGSARTTSGTNACVLAGASPSVYSGAANSYTDLGSMNSWMSRAAAAGGGWISFFAKLPATYGFFGDLGPNGFWFEVGNSTTRIQANQQAGATSYPLYPDHTGIADGTATHHWVFVFDSAFGAFARVYINGDLYFQGNRSSATPMAGASLPDFTHLTLGGLGQASGAHVNYTASTFSEVACGLGIPSPKVVRQFSMAVGCKYRPADVVNYTVGSNTEANTRSIVAKAKTGRAGILIFGESTSTFPGGRGDYFGQEFFRLLFANLPRYGLFINRDGSNDVNGLPNLGYQTVTSGNTAVVDYFDSLAPQTDGGSNYFCSLLERWVELPPVDFTNGLTIETYAQALSASNATSVTYTLTGRVQHWNNNPDVTLATGTLYTAGALNGGASFSSIVKGSIVVAGDIAAKYRWMTLTLTVSGGPMTWAGTKWRRTDGVGIDVQFVSAGGRMVGQELTTHPNYATLTNALGPWDRVAILLGINDAGNNSEDTWKTDSNTFGTSLLANVTGIKDVVWFPAPMRPEVAFMRIGEGHPGAIEELCATNAQFGMYNMRRYMNERGMTWTFATPARFVGTTAITSWTAGAKTQDAVYSYVYGDSTMLQYAQARFNTSAFITQMDAWNPILPWYLSSEVGGAEVHWSIWTSRLIAGYMASSLTGAGQTAGGGIIQIG